MFRRRWSALLAALALAACGAGVAAGHTDPCHTDRSCPSDDHSYVWHGESCTSDPAQRLPQDQEVLDEGGVRYYCHTVTDQDTVPPIGTTSTGATTTTQPTGTTTTSTTTTGGGGPTGCGGVSGRPVVAALADAGARRIAPTVTTTTVARLHGLRGPTGLSSTRAASERRRFRVLGRIVGARLGADGAWTLTLSGPGGGATTTAVFPKPSCVARAPKAFRGAVTRARRAMVRACALAGRRGTVRLRGEADVTGVGYFRGPGARIALRPAVAVAGLTCRRR